MMVDGRELTDDIREERGPKRKRGGGIRREDDLESCSSLGRMLTPRRGRWDVCKFGMVPSRNLVEGGVRASIRCKECKWGTKRDGASWHVF